MPAAACPPPRLNLAHRARRCSPPHVCKLQAAAAAAAAAREGGSKQQAASSKQQAAISNQQAGRQQQGFSQQGSRGGGSREGGSRAHAAVFQAPIKSSAAVPGLLIRAIATATRVHSRHLSRSCAWRLHPPTAPSCALAAIISRLPPRRSNTHRRRQRVPMAHASATTSCATVSAAGLTPSASAPGACAAMRGCA